MASLAERSYDAGFLRELATGARLVRRRGRGSAELAGFGLSPALASFVDFFTTHERDDRDGALGWFGAQGGTTVDWFPGRRNACEHALGQPWRVPAALAGALAIGADHGGNVWLVADAPLAAAAACSAAARRPSAG